jgi:hypothetical protein
MGVNWHQDGMSSSNSFQIVGLGSGNCFRVTLKKKVLIHANLIGKISRITSLLTSIWATSGPIGGL